VKRPTVVATLSAFDLTYDNPIDSIGQIIICDGQALLKLQQKIINLTKEIPDPRQELANYADDTILTAIESDTAAKINASMRNRMKWILPSKSSQRTLNTRHMIKKLRMITGPNGFHG
jgi:hypothetical protein